MATCSALTRERPMAVVRQLTRVDVASIQQVLDDAQVEPLSSLSQRKLNALGLPLAYVDRQQRYRLVNTDFLDCVAKRVDEVVGHTVFDVWGQEIYQLYQAYIEAALNGERTGFVRQLTIPSEPSIWIRVDYYPDRSPSGTVRGFLATYSDVDYLKRLELEAGQREHRLRLVTDSVDLPILYFDREFRLRFANKPFANWLGVEPDDLLGHGLKDFLPSDAFDQMTANVERVFEGATVAYERRDRKLDGELRWVRVTLFPDREVSGRVGGAFAVWNDIEDDVQTREALKAQEAQMRLFADNIPGPIAYLDKNLRYTFVNEAFLNLTGFLRDDVIGRTIEEVSGAEASLAPPEFVARALGGEAVTYERPAIDADNRPRWLRGRIVPDRKFDGTIKGVYVIAHDISDLKQVQNALAAREGQLRAIMDGVPAPVAYIDRDERCHYVNRTFLQYFGLTSEQVSRMRLPDIVGQGIYQSAQAMLTRALQGESTAFDRLVPGANGVRRWMTIRIVPDAASSGQVVGAFVLMNDIHGLKQAQEALRASEAELRLIMDNVPARVSYIDRDYRYRFLNRHNEEWLGASRRDLTGRRVSEVVGEERFHQLQPLLDRVLNGQEVTTEELLRQPDGKQRWESIHYAPNRDSEGNVIGIYAVHTDIHQEKHNAEALRRANWMLSSHINNTPLAVMEWDREFRLVRWSPQAENIFGWQAHEVLGMPITGNPLIHEADRETFAALAGRLMKGEEPRATGLTRNQRKDGETIWCEWYHSALLDDQGGIVSILSFVQHVSSRIEAEERLQDLATRDTLTGLPNRLLLHERLSQAISKARRAGQRVGVLFIDLDRFKNVNDTLGHRVGDELLKHVTRALSGALRETDLLARLGGDEFMVIVEDVDDPSVLSRIGQKLLDAIAQPFKIDQNDIFVTSSIGISVYPDDSDDPDELMKHADVALYRSKELGVNRYQFLDANLAEHRLKQHTLETALRGALSNGTLRLHYQPVVRITDRAIVGAEALLRWSDPEHGSIPPTVFIPLAEESGLIHALGEWVLKTAAAQCVAWRNSGMPLTISVNLSAKQFYRDDLSQRITEIVRAEGCEPSWIELEVTETSLVHDIDAIRKVLHQLRDEGFSVAIDDFGTGYSSLTHLKHFPIDTLKIDISFIADLETDPGDAAITEAIIGLARGLGLKVVAEGVGTREQLEFLDVRGCHYFQGFWVSKPLPAENFVEFVTRKPH